MKKITYILTITTMLQAMFAYAAISKWMDFSRFRAAMLLQPIPNQLAHALVYILPPIEIVIVALLFKPFVKYGLWLAALTMLAFTLYVGLGIAGILGHMPCSCGGIIENMPLGMHLVFNLIFLALPTVGIYIDLKEKRKEVQQK